MKLASLLSTKKDDIRLCIMQRAIPAQRLGVFNGFYRQEHVHHILLSNKLESSLAYRAGIKDNDVLIALNGVNVENYTYNQCLSRYGVYRDIPVDILVCDWATYQHYKNKNQTIHRDLPTVQHRRPVFATTSNYCQVFPSTEIVYRNHQLIF